MNYLFLFLLLWHALSQECTNPSDWCWDPADKTGTQFSLQTTTTDFDSQASNCQQLGSGADAVPVAKDPTAYLSLMKTLRSNTYFGTSANTFYSSAVWSNIKCMSSTFKPLTTPNTNACETSSGAVVEIIATGPTVTYGYGQLVTTTTPATLFMVGNAFLNPAQYICQRSCISSALTWTTYGDGRIEYLVPSCKSATRAQAYDLCSAANAVLVYIPDTTAAAALKTVMGSTSFWVGLRKTSATDLNSMWDGGYLGGFQLTGTLSSSTKMCLTFDPTTTKLVETDCTTRSAIICTREKLITLTVNQLPTSPLASVNTPLQTLIIQASSAPSPHLKMRITPSIQKPGPTDLISFNPTYFDVAGGSTIATFTLTPIDVDSTSRPLSIALDVSPYTTVSPTTTVVRYDASALSTGMSYLVNKCTFTTNFSNSLTLTVGQDWYLEIQVSCAPSAVTFTIGSSLSILSPGFVGLSTGTLKSIFKFIAKSAGDESVSITASGTGKNNYLSTGSYVVASFGGIKHLSQTITQSKTFTNISVRASDSITLTFPFPVPSAFTITFDGGAPNVVTSFTTTVPVNSLTQVIVIDSTKIVGAGTVKAVFYSSDTAYLTDSLKWDIVIMADTFTVKLPSSTSFYGGSTFPIVVQPGSSPKSTVTVTLSNTNCSFLSFTALPPWTVSNAAQTSTVTINQDIDQYCGISLTVTGTSAREYATIPDVVVQILARRAIQFSPPASPITSAYGTDVFTLDYVLPVDLIGPQTLTITVSANNSFVSFSPNTLTFNSANQAGNKLTVAMKILSNTTGYTKVTNAVSGDLVTFFGTTTPSSVNVAILSRYNVSLDHVDSFLLNNIQPSEIRTMYVGSNNAIPVVARAAQGFDLTTNLVINSSSTNIVANVTTLKFSQSDGFGYRDGSCSCQEVWKGLWVTAFNPGWYGFDLEVVNPREFMPTSVSGTAKNNLLIVRVLSLKKITLNGNVSQLATQLFIGAANSYLIYVVVPITSSMTINVALSNSSVATVNATSAVYPAAGLNTSFLVTGVVPGTVTVQFSVTGTTATEFEFTNAIDKFDLTFIDLVNLTLNPTQSRSMIVPNGTNVTIKITCPTGKWGKSASDVINISISSNTFVKGGWVLCKWAVASTDVVIIVLPIMTSLSPVQLPIMVNGPLSSYFNSVEVIEFPRIDPARTLYTDLANETIYYSVFPELNNTILHSLTLTELPPISVEFRFASNCSIFAPISIVFGKVDTLKKLFFLNATSANNTALYCTGRFYQYSGSVNFTIVNPNITIQVLPIQFIYVTAPRFFYVDILNSVNIDLRLGAPLPTDISDISVGLNVSVQPLKPSVSCYFLTGAMKNESVRNLRVLWNQTTDPLDATITIWSNQTVNPDTSQCQLTFSRLGTAKMYRINGTRASLPPTPLTSIVNVRPKETILFADELGNPIINVPVQILYLNDNNFLFINFTCAPNPCNNVIPSTSSTTQIQVARLGNQIRLTGIATGYPTMTYTFSSPMLSIYNVTSLNQSYEVRELDRFDVDTRLAGLGNNGPEQFILLANALTFLDVDILNPPLPSYYVAINATSNTPSVCVIQPTFVMWSGNNIITYTSTNNSYGPTYNYRATISFQFIGLTPGNCNVTFAISGTANQFNYSTFTSSFFQAPGNSMIVLMKPLFTLNENLLLMPERSNLNPKRYIMPTAINTINITLTNPSPQTRITVRARVTGSDCVLVTPLVQEKFASSAVAVTDGNGGDILFRAVSNCNTQSDSNIATFSFELVPPVVTIFNASERFSVNVSVLSFGLMFLTEGTRAIAASAFCPREIKRGNTTTLTVFIGKTPKVYDSVIVTFSANDVDITPSQFILNASGSTPAKLGNAKLTPLRESDNVTITTTLSGPSATMFASAPMCTNLVVLPPLQYAQIDENDPSADVYVRSETSLNGKQYTVTFPVHPCAANVLLKIEYDKKNNRFNPDMIIYPAEIVNNVSIGNVYSFTVTAGRAIVAANFTTRVIGASCMDTSLKSRTITFLPLKLISLTSRTTIRYLQEVFTVTLNVTVNMPKTDYVIMKLMATSNQVAITQTATIFNTSDPSSSTLIRTIDVRAAASQQNVTIYGTMLNGSTTTYGMLNNLTFQMLNQKKFGFPMTGLELYENESRVLPLSFVFPIDWVNVTLYSRFVTLNITNFIMNGSSPNTPNFSIPILLTPVDDINATGILRSQQYLTDAISIMFSGPSTREYVSDARHTPPILQLTIQQRSRLRNVTTLPPYRFIGSTDKVKLNMQLTRGTKFPLTLTSKFLFDGPNCSAISKVIPVSSFRTAVPLTYEFDVTCQDTGELDFARTVTLSFDVQPVGYQNALGCPPDIVCGEVVMGRMIFRSKLPVTFSDGLTGRALRWECVMFVGEANTRIINVSIPLLRKYYTNNINLTIAGLIFSTVRVNPNPEAVVLIGDMDVTATFNLTAIQTDYKTPWSMHRLGMVISASMQLPEFMSNYTVAKSDGIINYLVSQWGLWVTVYPLIRLFAYNSDGIQINRIEVFVTLAKQDVSKRIYAEFTIKLDRSVEKVDQFAISYNATMKPAYGVNLQPITATGANNFPFGATSAGVEYRFKVFAETAGTVNVSFNLQIPHPKFDATTPLMVVVLPLRKLKWTGWKPVSLFSEPVKIEVVMEQEPKADMLLLSIGACEMEGRTDIVPYCNGVTAQACNQIFWMKSEVGVKKTIEFALQKYSNLYDASNNLIDKVSCSVSLRTSGDPTFEENVLQSSVTYRPKPTVSCSDDSNTYGENAWRSSSVAIQCTMKFADPLLVGLNSTMCPMGSDSHAPYNTFSILFIPSDPVYVSVKNFTNTQISVFARGNEWTIEFRFSPITLPTLINGDETITVYFFRSAFQSDIPGQRLETTFRIRSETQAINSEVKVVTTMLSVGASSPSGGSGMNKIKALLASIQCPAELDEWVKDQNDLQGMEHLYGISFSSSSTRGLRELGVYTAASILNITVLVYLAIFHWIIVILIYTYRKRGGYSDKSIRASMAAARFPSLLLIPGTIYYQSGVTNSLKVMLYTTVSSYQVMAFFSLVVYVFTVPMAIYYVVRKNNFHAHYERSHRPPLWGLVYQGRWHVKNDDEFVPMFGQAFESFRSNCQWYQLGDLFLVFLLGLADAFEPSTPVQCIIRQSFVVVIFFFQAVVLWYLSPYDGVFDRYFFQGSSLVQFVSCGLILYTHIVFDYNPLTTSANAARVIQDKKGNYLTTLIAIHIMTANAGLMTLKSVVDVFRLVLDICPCFATHSQRVVQVKDRNFVVNSDMGNVGVGDDAAATTTEMEKFDRHKGIDKNAAPGVRFLTDARSEEKSTAIVVEKRKTADDEADELWALLNDSTPAQLDNAQQEADLSTALLAPTKPVKIGKSKPENTNPGGAFFKTSSRPTESNELDLTML